MGDIDLNKVGVINTSAKFKNFQSEVKTCIIQYREFYNESNINDFLNLLIGKYLKLDSLDLWQDDPEQFIEIEDESIFLRESQINRDQSYSVLSYAVAYKLLDYFAEFSQPWLFTNLSKLIENNEKLENLCEIAIENKNPEENYYGLEMSDLIEDAVLNLAGLLPNIYRYKRTPAEERLKIETILGYLENKINNTDNKLFKRRYCLLLSTWSEEMQLPILLEYLAKSGTLIFSGGSSDVVIKFEAMNSVRDILRVIEEIRTNHKNKAITEEDSAKIIDLINERLNYRELFETISPI